MEAKANVVTTLLLHEIPNIIHLRRSIEFGDLRNARSIIGIGGEFSISGVVAIWVPFHPASFRALLLLLLWGRRVAIAIVMAVVANRR
jgi:hypothetical protein